MSTKGGLIFLITSIILVLGCIVALIGIYYFDWMKPTNSGYSLYTTTSDNDARFAVNNNDDIILDNQNQQYNIPSLNVQTTTTSVSDKYEVIENVDKSSNHPYYTINVSNDTNVTNTTLNTDEKNKPFPKRDSVLADNESEKASVAISEKSNQNVLSTKTDTENSDKVVAQTSLKSDKSDRNQVAVSSSSEHSKDKSPKNNIPENKKVSESQKKDVTVAYIPNNVKKTSSGNPVAPSSTKKTQTFVKSEPIGKDGSPLKIGFTFDKNREFHSYGQYISADEYKYRLAVINNLKIKTIVIDSVTKGNGISQEYYKVAYNANMIPAKILDEITTSKEFRNLIPKKYLDIEEHFTSFPKDGKVSFNNTDIKELLILWSQGKLTPTQKAWEVKATL